MWTDTEAAHLLAATLNRLPVVLSRSGTILLVLHESPGSSPAAGDGPALSALAHHAAVRLLVVRERWLPNHKDVRGYEARVGIQKNRLGPAGRTVLLTIEFNGTVRGNGL